MLKNRFRSSFIILIFIAFTVVLLFRDPIKVFVRDQMPEIAYLRLSWIKNIITGNDFGFYKYEIRLADQYSDINNYIDNEQFEFSVKLKKNKALSVFQIPPLFPGISVDEVNTAYIDFYQDDLIYATKNGAFFNCLLYTSPSPRD